MVIEIHEKLQKKYWWCSTSIPFYVKIINIWEKLPAHSARVQSLFKSHEFQPSFWFLVSGPTYCPSKEYSNVIRMHDYHLHRYRYFLTRASNLTRVMHEIQSTTRILQRHLQYDLKSEIEVSSIKFPHYQVLFKTPSFTSLIFNIDTRPIMFGMLNFWPNMMSCLQKCHPLDRDPETSVPNDLIFVGLQESRHRASEALACQPCGSQLDETSIICTRCLAPCFLHQKNGWQNIYPAAKTKNSSG